MFDQSGRARSNRWIFAWSVAWLLSACEAQPRGTDHTPAVTGEHSASPVGTALMSSNSDFETAVRTVLRKTDGFVGLVSVSDVSRRADLYVDETDGVRLEHSGFVLSFTTDKKYWGTPPDRLLHYEGCVNVHNPDGTVREGGCPVAEKIAAGDRLVVLSFGPSEVKNTTVPGATMAYGIMRVRNDEVELSSFSTERQRLTDVENWITLAVAKGPIEYLGPPTSFSGKSDGGIDIKADGGN